MASAAPITEGSAADFDEFNPFFAPSTLPFQAPRFDAVRNEHFLPAFEAGIAESLAEVERLANSPDHATFDNTIVALELGGDLLNRVATVFFTLAGANTNAEIQQLQQQIAPRLAAASDAVYLNERLFARVRAVYDMRETLDLDAESMRLLEVTYDQFVKAGALLPAAGKAEIAALNMELSTLQASFLNHLMDGVREAALHVDDEAALEGLSQGDLAKARDAAAQRQLGGYVLRLVNTTQQPALSRLKDRQTRAQLWERSLSRNEQGNGLDTREVVARIAHLRARKARILGYESYAEWKLGDQMARTPAAAIAFLDALVPAATASVAAESQRIAAAKIQAGDETTLEPYDWAFYAEQLRRAEYDLDEDALKPYFELSRVFHEGVLCAATELYGIRFVPRDDLPVWYAEVQTYDVFDTDGSHLALLYTDFFKRDSKRGGAWMSSLVTQSLLRGQLPIIANVCNFTKPADGEAALLSWDEVRTLFHEFGHALHGIFSQARYPSLSGTSVARDFVEFPSQFNEHWAEHPLVFERYARHYSTGEPMPAEMRERMRRARNFNGGHRLAEVLAAAELDLQWHTLDADAPLRDSAAFEVEALSRKRVNFAAIPPRYRSTYFSHSFGGGYAAGYYAYLWAEMLDADAYDWFERNGGLTRANGDRLRRMVLSRGNTADPAALYRGFRGQDGVIEPMLRERGLEQ